MAGTKAMRETFRRALAGLERALLQRGGVTSQARRRAAASGERNGDGALADYLGRVREAAHRITDEEVEALRSKGCTDDELFELTICGAFGAARERLSAGLSALDAAYEPDASKKEEQRDAPSAPR